MNRLATAYWKVICNFYTFSDRSPPISLSRPCIYTFFIAILTIHPLTLPPTGKTKRGRQTDVTQSLFSTLTRPSIYREYLTVAQLRIAFLHPSTKAKVVMVSLIGLVLKQENILDYSVINFTKSVVLFSKILQRWRHGKSNDQHC